MSHQEIIQQRIAALQHSMKQEGIDAWLILSSDPHLSEYLPEHWKLRAWFSGFTGSAGTLVVLQEQAFIWADSRYWVQGQKELEGSGIQLMKLGSPGTPSYTQFLVEKLPAKSVVSVLGDTIAIENFVELFNALNGAGIFLSTEHNPFDELYPDRPALPQEKLYLHNPKFVSETIDEKVRHIQSILASNNVDFHLVSTLDDIGWITNLRGSDVEYNPVFLAFMLFSLDSDTLFIDEAKLTAEITEYLTQNGVKILPYEALNEELGKIPTDAVVMLDGRRTTYSSLEAIDEACEVVYHVNPSTLLKASKSDADLENIKEAMAEDGAAMAEFFTYFEQKLSAGEKVTELTVAEMLEEARSKRPNYVSLSFGTIAGFNENGALPHYSATEEAHAEIKGNGLLLIDSGAQYEGGTTDITRVTPIGTISEAERRDFTLVLKSLIAMSQTIYPENIKMPLLDAIARRPLWENHIDFGHGTGHGVGYFMNVHEGPQVLSYHAPVTPQTEVKKGMITSIEPGIYREGKWGVRLENLVASLPVVKQKEQDFGNFMYFETLTLFPIDTRAIERALLTTAEIEWLNQYHAKVWEKLSPKIEDPAVLEWLKARTEAI